MESIIRDYLMDYFLKNKFINMGQYGFIKGRSTAIQLLKIMDDWTECIDNGLQVDIIYTDFEKAFDKVPHIRLINRLKAYGVLDAVIRWVEAFLTGRTQKIAINGTMSSTHPVLSGIPQGSVLGPLLFIIFINDLPDMCNQLSSMYLFADDAKMYKIIHSDSDSMLLNESYLNMIKWCDTWCMKLNLDKCKVLSITKNMNAIKKYQYGNSNIGILDHIDVIKDLGVNIDTTIGFKTQIYEKINKAYQMLGIINRNFYELDTKSFLMIYKSMVRSHLEYAAQVWCPFKQGLIEDMEKVQKRATKMIKGLSKMSYRERLMHINLPTLRYRRLRGDMIEVFKILNGFYDENIAPKLIRNLDGRTRGNSEKLIHRQSNTDIRKFSFCVRVVGAWNSLPNSVIQSTSINNFKNNLDNHWKNEEIYYNWEVNLSALNS